MAGLVAEMTEERAVGFAHVGAAPLAFGAFRFDRADGDDAVGMSGHDRRPALHFGENVEG